MKAIDADAEAKQGKVMDLLKQGFQFNVYQMLQEIKNGVYKPQEEIKILNMTWNMGRKAHKPDFTDLLPNVQIYDFVFITMQEVRQRDSFIQRLDAFMESHDIKQLNNTHMFEMCLIVYAKKHHLKFMNGKVETNTKALGFAKVFGNKGGMQIYFTWNEFHFNIFGLHLLHGQDNRVKRDIMMEDIVRYFRNERPEMDPDMSYDYSFILGDLNYRLDSNFHDLIMT